MLKEQGIIVIPGAVSGVVSDPALCRRLSRGRVVRETKHADVLGDVARMLGMPDPAARGALRYFGQTGARPEGWIAAADPVHLEARLRDIVVRNVPPLPRRELRDVFDALNEALANGVRFECHDACCYVRSDARVASATEPAAAREGRSPELVLSNGDAATAYQRLMGEIQMLLHEHEVNAKRADEGQPTVNALWIWGGGTMPAPADVALPDLYADDPEWLGAWKNCGGHTRPWPGSLGEVSQRRFVAVLPAVTNLDETLCDVTQLLRRDELPAVSIRALDGVRIDLGRRDGYRIWRRMSPHLEVTPGV